MSKTSKTTHDRLLTVKDLSDRMQVSDKTIRRLIDSGKLKAIWIGPGEGSLRVTEHAYQDYLKSRIS